MARTVAASRHLERVASLGCVLCDHLSMGYSPAEIHHLKEGCGMSQRSSDFLTVPLCPEHHRGKTGLHGLGTRGFQARYKLSELDLLALATEKLA